MDAPMPLPFREVSELCGSRTSSASRRPTCVCIAQHTLVRNSAPVDHTHLQPAQHMPRGGVPSHSQQSECSQGADLF
eukprot:647430-Pelagomonas_calceolata.AAC.5